MLEADWVADTRASYDTVAGTYADMFRDELRGQPVIRHLLAMFAELVRDAGGGPVVDVGCGTGRVTAHLRGLGADAFGVDLSPGMVAMARRDHPGIRFDVGYGGHPMRVNVHWRPLERVAGWLDGAGLRTELRVEHDIGDERVSGGMLVARG
ncbi:class I SAM-dependent DNA methyltransferase [Virgisporangium ochraceum]|uniref:Methyltransferase domain-containing protein n=1 Tax=Virgisporangium ochraceum TaxID=65505 RepID=A0A8J3ZMA6_9ACTN|nr:class I SAM-dependent methyltransferase [Virgisporangium ochraceum]GIJ66647.1 hypothetical protein Voc01_015640 [Virgisporangium ochraceum]